MWENFYNFHTVYSIPSFFTSSNWFFREIIVVLEVILFIVQKEFRQTGRNFKSKIILREIVFVLPALTLKSEFPSQKSKISSNCWLTLVATRNSLTQLIISHFFCEIVIISLMKSDVKSSLSNHVIFFLRQTEFLLRQKHATFFHSKTPFRRW